MDVTVLVILGMRSNECRERIAAQLATVTGVTDVDVSFYRGTAMVRHLPACDVGSLLAAVARAGYGAALAPPRGGRRSPGPGSRGARHEGGESRTERP